MANIKISNLQEIEITNPDKSFVMIVAQDSTTGVYKNYRITLSDLRDIIGSIEGDIVTGVTEEQVRDIVNAAISYDNTKELTEEDVQRLIDVSIENIPPVEPGLSETEVRNIVSAAIADDNRNELTYVQVSSLIDTKISGITPGISETQVQEMINTSILADNVSELQESRVQEMIDASITTDNLKEHIETVVPEVIPSVLPEVLPEVLPTVLTDVQLEVKPDVVEEPVVITITEIAEKSIINETTITQINNEIVDNCVCAEHADDCFSKIFQ